MIYDLLERLNLRQKRDGIYMTVPRELKGRIKFEDVRRALVRRGVVNANLDVIYRVVAKADGIPTKVGDYFERYNRIKDKFIHIRIDDDKLTTYLSIRFPREENQKITVFDIHFKLMEANIRYGIDDKLIERIIKEQKNVINLPIAKGKPPIHGKNAEVVFKIDTNISRKPLILPDGSVDFHQINLIKIVEKDQHLAEKIPATKGASGISVYGTVLEAVQGKDKALPRGLNTYISDDKHNLYAKMGGHIFFLQNLLNVENVFVVRKNVDFSTGDIDYTGDVLVFGDVKTGFKITTDGNIRIRGNVDGAEVISRKGKIEIEGGIFGKHKAKLYARQLFQADFVQEAYVQCGGDIEVNRYIINCAVKANGEIRVPKGNIIGGNVMGGVSVIAREIGSPNNQHTEVRIGNDVDPNILIEILSAKDEEKKIVRKIHTLQKKVDFLKMLEKRLVKLTDEKELELENLLKEIQSLNLDVQNLHEKTKVLLGENNDIRLEEPYIEARNFVFPGVVIGINSFEQTIQKQIRRVTFKLDETGIHSENHF
ncbi:MAG TPA: DUF342 domain-containing protein [Bacteroidetes bacterium]|nr:DUF342 domain-containing protein [Bacteroidota bacterium]